MRCLAFWRRMMLFLFPPRQALLFFQSFKSLWKACIHFNSDSLLWLVSLFQKSRMLYVLKFIGEYLVILGAKELEHYMADYNLSISDCRNSSSRSQFLFAFGPFTSIFDEVLLLSVSAFSANLANLCATESLTQKCLLLLCSVSVYALDWPREVERYAEHPRLQMLR